ncbi:MAG TPA: acyl-CoA synthetase [Gammaproteobacteria bacterium]|nr:acyl-CoA synthetase [Gammaproteobacteria bacterium]
MTEKALPLIKDYRPEAVLIQQGGNPITQSEFLAATSAAAEALPDAPYLINLCRDRYAFMLAFCAALLRHRTTLLPPNRQAATLAELAADYPGAHYLSDREEDLPDIPGMTVSGIKAPGPAPAVPAIPADHIAAIAHTSGSTGRPEPIVKPWRTLAGTAALLNRRFNNDATVTPSVVATVPSQHMYGLEMTVLLALQGRARLNSAHPFYPSDIAATLAAVPAPRLLVTTPAHLRALLGSNIELPPVAKTVSATAPLARELAAQAEQGFGGAVEEIYGCTEAGSLATRRTTTGEPWRLLNGMRLTQGPDGLRVTGPQLPNAPLLQDHLELIDDTHFRFLGRASDTINVAGKRGSLADLTLKLLSVPGVEDAFVYLPEGARRPAAVVVSKRSEQALLKDMAAKVDPVFLPRPLRKVAAIPRNETGKVTRELLKTLAP